MVAPLVLMIASSIANAAMKNMFAGMPSASDLFSTYIPNGVPGATSYGPGGLDIYNTPSLGQNGSVSNPTFSSTGTSKPYYQPPNFSFTNDGSGSGSNDSNGDGSEWGGQTYAPAAPVFGNAKDAPTTGNNFNGYGSLMAALQAGAFPGNDPEWQGIAQKYGVTGPQGQAPQAVTNPPGLTSSTVTSPQSFSRDNVYAPVNLGGIPGVTTSAASLFGSPDTSGQGFTPFVPDTMGLSLDRSKAFADQADLFQKQADEYDLSPITAAGKQAFDNRRQQLTQAREQALGNINAQFERNRISGSSLAASEITRAGLSFDDAEKQLSSDEATFNAQAKLQELTAKSDLMQKAFATRTQAIQTQIDDTFKIADFGSKNAEVQASLIDSQNKLKAAFAGIDSQTRDLQMQLMAQEAQSIRSNLTQISVGSANNDAMAQVEQNKVDLARDQGTGKLLSPIIEPVTAQIGKSFSDWLFS